MCSTGCRIIAVIFIMLIIPAFIFGNEDPSMQTIKDAAGMFNERGYLKSNSYSLDGNEVVNNYNGNLIYTQRLLYLPITQNGIHLDLKIAYNGSVGHTIFSGYKRAIGWQKQNSLNLPEWIISVNDIAIQTFNYEDEWITWATGSDTISYSQDVAALINGYHSCHTFNNMNTPFHGTISILTGDGGVRQFISNDSGDFAGALYCVYRGGYYSFSKDDKARGYVNEEDSTFTLFEENGTKVIFKFYRPAWKTIIDPANEDIESCDSLLMLLPIRFEDQMGHSFGISYIYNDGGDQIKGRPYVDSAYSVAFSWTGPLEIFLNSRKIYGVGIGNGCAGVPSSDRKMATYIRDNGNNRASTYYRETSFNYSCYNRIGISTDAPIRRIRCLDSSGNPYTREIAHGFDLINSRLYEIVYPDGGQSVYSYSEDDLTKWPPDMSGVWDQLEANYDEDLCLNPPPHPCIKSDKFDLLGRDPYFINMVTAARRIFVNSNDTTIVSSDSLRFWWRDIAPTQEISPRDTFFTERLSCRDDFDSPTGQIKKFDFIYKQTQENGPYSDLERDRGWVIKLHRTIQSEAESPKGGDLSKATSSVQTDDVWDECPNCTFQLLSQTVTKDGVSMTDTYGYDWHGSATDQRVSNLDLKTITDLWGNRTEIFYDTLHYNISGPTSFYSATLIDSTMTFNVNNVLLSKAKTGFYNFGAQNGYVGQASTEWKYVIENGSEISSLYNGYLYYKNIAYRDIDEGALRKMVTPEGDSILYYYNEKTMKPKGYTGNPGIDSVVNPVLYEELLTDNSIHHVSDKFDNNGPFHYKSENYKSNTIFGYDTIVAVDTTPICGIVNVIADASNGQEDTKSDYIYTDQTIDYHLLLIESNCNNYLYRALILRNTDTIKVITCSSPDLDVWGSFNASRGDLVKVTVALENKNKGQMPSGPNRAEFWHYDSTGFKTDTIGIRKLDAVIDYQFIDNLGNLWKSVAPNKYLSGITHDSIWRFDRAILPGAFTSSYDWPTNDSVYSLRFNYDDRFNDGSPTGVTSLIRPDNLNFSKTDRVWFDGFGRATKHDAIHSGGAIDSSMTGYDFANRIVSQKDQLGFVSTFEYDFLDRKAGTHYPDTTKDSVSYFGTTTTATDLRLDTLGFNFRHNGIFGVTYTDEDGNQVKEYSDVRGKLRLRREQVDASNTLSTYFDYDDLGNPKTVIRPKGDKVNYLHNSLGQLAKEWSADYDTIYYKYDKNGNMIARRDGNLKATDSSGYERWRYFEYDALDRVTKSGIKLVKGASTLYNQTPIIRYFYDQYLSTLSQGELSLTYINEEDFRYGERYDYDARGRIIKQTNYYKAILDSLIEPGTTNHRVWKLRGDSVMFRFEYNQADQITKTIYPDSTDARYTYDDRGRMDQIGIANDNDKYADFAYTKRDERQQVKLGNAIQTVDYVYNSRGWLGGINQPTASDDKFAESLYYKINPLNQTGYKNGNISGQKLKVDTDLYYRKYTYDKTDRLTKSYLVYPPSSSENREEFSYDKNGNFTNVKFYHDYFYDDTILDINYQYFAGSNKLSGISGDTVNSFTYDANGNLKTDALDTTSFFYTRFNHLSRIEMRADGEITPQDSLEYRYNPDGQRVYKKYRRHYWEKCGEEEGTEPWDKFPDPGIPKIRVPDDKSQDTASGTRSIAIYCLRSDTAVTRYYYSLGKVLMETNGSGGNRTKYIYAGYDRIGMIDPAGNIYYYLKDHLGSTRVTLKDNGVVYGRYYEYRAFGDVVNESVTLNQAYKFTGKPLDMERGLNLYYFGARYYDPALGRWLSPDPAAGKYPGLSPYAYCSNIPLKYVDPNGEAILPFLAAWAMAIAADPVGFQLDLMQLSMDQDKPLDMFLDVVAIATPGISAAQTKSVWKFGENAMGIASKMIRGMARFGGKIETHHLLPKQFKPFFKAAGINIENYTIRMLQGDHRLKALNGIHTLEGGHWNKRWAEFFEKHKKASPDEILDYLGQLKKEFKIDELEVTDYDDFGTMGWEASNALSPR